MCVSKVLGILWNLKSDTLHFKFPVQIDKLLNASISKRTILHTIAYLYCLLGLLGPLMFKSKVFFQELWRKNYGWDDHIEMEDREK